MPLENDSPGARMPDATGNDSARAGMIDLAAAFGFVASLFLFVVHVLLEKA